MDYATLADNETVQRTMKNLKENGIDSFYTQTEEEAKEKVLGLIPEGAEVFNMTSVTLDALGISKEITESGKYNAVRNELMKMDRNTQSLQMQKLGSAPEYTIGSVHAVTEDGKLMIASKTGSQLAAYVYGSMHVTFVVGTQKIVKDMESGLKRIYEHTLPLESERAMKAYGVGSSVNKLLIINNEIVPGRINVIFLNKLLGF